MKSILPTLLALSLFSSAHALGIPGGPRCALLLSNYQFKDYEFTNAAPSLDLMQEALEKEGYRVTRIENLPYKEQEKAVEAFAKTVPTNGVCLVYVVGFSAHMERFGKWYNYLRPAKEEIRSDGDYRGRGLDLAKIPKILETHAGSRHNLIFLDTAWESPVLPASKNLYRGLVEIESIDPGRTVLAYSAGIKKAHPLPQGGQPSPFARKLAAHLPELETSTRQACQALGDIWFSAAEGHKIGEPSSLPRMSGLGQGKVPGTGFTNSTGMSFRWCPPGTFQLGTKRTDTPYTRDRKPVEVTLTRGFWIGQHEVTQREYMAVMRKNPPRGFSVGTNIPWWGVGESKQVREFCKKLGEIERKSGTLPKGWKYDILTEAQWEYACRAGSDSIYCFGDDVTQLGRYANFADKALHSDNPDFYWAEKRSDDGVAEALAPVGSYLPNAWGIHDMHGNVAEIVADNYLPVRLGGKDPLVQVKKDARGQTRGGAWCSLPLYCESTFRNPHDVRNKPNHVGFRVAITQE